MKKDPVVFLKHILESVDYINDYVKDLSEDDFFDSMKFCKKEKVVFTTDRDIATKIWLVT